MTCALSGRKTKKTYFSSISAVNDCLISAQPPYSRASKLCCSSRSDTALFPRSAHRRNTPRWLPGLLSRLYLIPRSGQKNTSQRWLTGQLKYTNLCLHFGRNDTIPVTQSNRYCNCLERSRCSHSAHRPRNSRHAPRTLLSPASYIRVSCPILRN